jgi:hypothetical protein
MIGDATDENDVILCDGQNCHRAFHMKCVFPAVSEQELGDENEDWFCPLCSGISNLMGETHDLCIGMEEGDDEGGSIESWDDVQDVFPDAEWEYETALKLLKGKRNEDTQRLLTLFLGEDIIDKPGQMPVGSDSEDENDYSLFDEDSFEERKRKAREEEGGADEDDSTRSSEATLVDMSSVEYNVGKDELAALSDVEGQSDGNSSEADGSENDEKSNAQRARRSRRLQKRLEAIDGGESKSGDFGADFSEANIIEGKRKRKKIDYRKLNDMMFGDLDDSQNRMIDDPEDFVDRQRKSRGRSGSDNDSGDDDGDGNDSNDGNDVASDDEEESGNSIEEGSDDDSADGSSD